MNIGHDLFGDKERGRDWHIVLVADIVLNLFLFKRLLLSGMLLVFSVCDRDHPFESVLEVVGEHLPEESRLVKVVRKRILMHWSVLLQRGQTVEKDLSLSFLFLNQSTFLSDAFCDGVLG